jgi:hypothetical protein
MTTLVVIGVVWLLGYWISLRLHPHMRCRRCVDSPGKEWGGMWTNTFRVCHKCSGRGRRQRLGAWVLGYGEPRYRMHRVRHTSEFPPPARTAWFG